MGGSRSPASIRGKRMRREIKSPEALKEMLIGGMGLHKSPLGFIVITQAVVLVAVLSGTRHGCLPHPGT